jgi:hypothetical protein
MMWACFFSSYHRSDGGSLSDAKNVDCSQFAFAYRRNGDGSVDLICLACYLTAATADNEAEVHEREKGHYCARNGQP